MAGFMDDAHQTGQKAVFSVARGHSHILGHAATKRMGALVEPASFEIESHQPHRIQTQCALTRFGERPLRLQGLLLRLSGLHCVDHVGQPLAQLAENPIDLVAAHAGLVLIHQRVIEC